MSQGPPELEALTRQQISYAKAKSAGLRPAAQPIPRASLAHVPNPAACNDNLGSIPVDDLVPLVRRKLKISHEVPDACIAADLTTIMQQASDRERWGASFASHLALWLSAQGRELGRALTTLLSMVPPAKKTSAHAHKRN